MAMNLGMNSRGAVSLGSVEIPSKFFNRFGTGIASIDNMFGDSGFISGQVITVSAMRGCGKTTMLLQVLEGVTRNHPDKRCLYLSGEEYVEQLAFMAKRIDTPNVLADNETDVDKIAAMTKEYDIIAIDSMASLTSQEHKTRNAIEAYAMNVLYKAAKENDCVVIFVLHQTKDGKVFGASSLEHSADTCIKLFNVDSEEFGELNAKAFCVDKNRFGMTKDSIFRMTSKGWDFANPVREDYDKNKSKADVRSDKIQNELEKILSLKKFQMSALQTITTDMKILSRLARRVNDLVKAGKIKKFGRGDKAIYVVKESK